MADLEAKILAGSSGSGYDLNDRSGANMWTDASSDRDSDDGSEIDNEAANGAGSRMAELDREYNNEMDKRAAEAADPFFERTHGPKTGPKGVKADKAWHDSLVRKESDRVEMRALETARRAGYGATLAAGEQSLSLASQHWQQGERRAARERAHSDSSDDHADAGITSKLRAADAAIMPAAPGENVDRDADDDADDAALAAYRASRLAQLRLLAALPRYGTVYEVKTAGDLPTIVDGTHKDTFALCLIWDDYCLTACRPWIDAWTSLAASHPHTRFITLQASVASQHWDPISLPALCVYRAGEVAAVHVRLQGSGDEGGSGLGGKPTSTDVDGWLAGNGWLKAT